MAGASVEESVAEELSCLGCAAVVAARGGRFASPDVVALCPGGRVVAVEAKSTAEALRARYKRPRQADRLSLWRSLGAAVLVVFPCSAAGLPPPPPGGCGAAAGLCAADLEDYLSGNLLAPRPAWLALALAAGRRP